MNKDQLIYLDHILTCIDKIQDYTLNVSKEKFLTKSLIQDGVIRNLEIIGEATKHLDKEFRVKYPETEWKKIAGLRDKLIHDYIGVDLIAVWKVVDQIIPEFRLQILEILRAEKL
ncbi:MAG: DUF86 domain-containing protein [Sphingobacteriaceae bacterium]|nr:MAG: DUF86 domain-containing protein [Sphingobacteriaceae bacterium]